MNFDPYAEASTDADDRQSVGITGEEAVGGLVCSGAADAKQVRCFGHGENLRSRVSRTSFDGLSACIRIRSRMCGCGQIFSRKSKLGSGVALFWSVKAAAKPMRPEGLALRDRLVGMIAMVRPQADLVAIGRQGNTWWTFSEVARYLQHVGLPCDS